jgi:hypothetical protein
MVAAARELFEFVNRRFVSTEKLRFVGLEVPLPVSETSCGGRYES